MKKNMFTETEMTSLLFTRAEENGVRSTSRENLAFKLPLNQHRGVTRQNFRDLETVPGAAAQMPHHTVDVWHREGHCHHRLGCRLNLTLPCRPGESDSVLSRSKPCCTITHLHSTARLCCLPVLMDPAHLTSSELQPVIEIISSVKV